MHASSDHDFLIAQLSDLHVRPKGKLYKDVVDSNALLSAKPSATFPIWTDSPISS